MYYLFVNGNLKKVDQEPPEGWKAYLGGNLRNSLSKYGYDQCQAYKFLLDSLPEIEVHPDLAKVFKDGERYYEGKHFTLQCTRCKQYPTSKECETDTIAIPLPVEPDESQEENEYILEELYKNWKSDDGNKYLSVDHFLQYIDKNYIITEK